MYARKLLQYVISIIIVFGLISRVSPRIMIILAHVYLVTKHLSWFPSERVVLLIFADCQQANAKGDVLLV